MSSRIKDLVEISAPAADAARGQLSALSGFLLTYELGDALARIVELLVASGEGKRNCLIVGSSGCGKSTLMSAACELVTLPASVDVVSRIAEIRMSVKDVEVHPIRVEPLEGERRLSTAIERAVVAFCLEFGLPFRESEDDAALARLDAVSATAVQLAPGRRLVFAIDDLDLWLADGGRHAFENIAAVGRLGALSHDLPLATCAVAGGGVLADDARSGEGQGWMASLVNDFQIVYIPSHTVRTATASRVLTKNARQRREILEVLGRLREKLPQLNYSDEEFVELYPLEVSTWTIGGHLHRWIEGFSFPEFAARAAESVRGRPKLSLFALNDMFSRYEGDLRRVESLEAIFASYDRLQTDALPKLGASQRLWASLALQSIFMHTIAGISADVTTLTNSVLLYNLHGTGSSYVYMAAVLKQLETHARGEIVGRGDGAARQYALVSGHTEAVRATVDEMADRIDDEDELAWALASFGGHYFADWPLGETVTGPIRGDLWSITQSARAIVLQARALGMTDALPAAPPVRPRLVIFAPGRSWSEARDEAVRTEGTAVWLGGVATPDIRQALKRWMAATRFSASEEGARFSDLDAVRREAADQCIAAFHRVYIERGMLVTAERSDQMADITHESRDENLVVKLLPHRAIVSAAAAASASAPAATNHVAEALVWLAHLTAQSQDEVATLTSITDTASWLQRLETWYTTWISRRALQAVEHLRESGADAEALDAVRQFEVALATVRKALMAGSLTGVRHTLVSVFETPERLWSARSKVAALETFADRLSEVETIERYLAGAGPVDDPVVEELRRTTLAGIHRSDWLADDERRRSMDDAFAKFRDVYSVHYAAEHNKSVAPEAIDTLGDALVGSRAWRTLEALAGLRGGDTSRLVEATNQLSALRERECEADVFAMLRERPRCGCGFWFGDRSRVIGLAANALDVVHQGIVEHRETLRARKSELRAKLKARKSRFSVETIRVIAALIGDDELPELDDATTAALDELLDPESV